MFKVADQRQPVEDATALAIGRARERNALEVTPDDLLSGCLLAISRLGIAMIGTVAIDLEALGVDWLRQTVAAGAKISYSDEVVRIFDKAALIARSDGARRLSIDHLLAAFANECDGLMADLLRTHHLTGAGWRAALASNLAPGIAEGGAALSQEDATQLVSQPGALREYLSPEDAAAELGIHVQTVRAYVRSGKLPALRLAGERAIRIRRRDLHQLLEPLQTES